MQALAERRLSRMSARVRRGAALLDAEIPEWASRIDLDRLDLRDHGCVLAQLGSPSLGLGVVSVARYGFDATFASAFLGRSDEQYRALAILWAAEVIVRRRRADLRRLVAPPRVEVPVLV